MPVWSPDLVVDEGLARRLLGQFPELEVRSLRRFAEGWDNAVWLVNERWAFRFPQRAIGVPGIERELAVLPRLAGRLPLPVPDPHFVGRPAGEYPWHFFGGELLAGREACDAGLNGAARAAVAIEVAGSCSGPACSRSRSAPRSPPTGIQRRCRRSSAKRSQAWRARRPRRRVGPARQPSRGVIVYAVIRNYSGNTELADQLAARADEVLGLVSGVPGFRGYYLVRTDDGCTTVSVYDDEEGAAESSRVAAGWIRDHASEITASTPQVTSGEVLIGG